MQRKNNDLISRSALREWWLNNGQNEHIYDTNDVLDSIDDAPSVDAEPVRHGHWIFGDQDEGEPDIKCSVCGYELNYECKVSQDDMKYFDMNYCNCCGAAMLENGGNDEQ